MTPRPYHRPAWSTRPAVVVASGPSLSDEQLAHVEGAHASGKCHVIAVNNTAERAPWADVAYFGDYMALKHYRPKLERLVRSEWVTQCRASSQRWKLTHLKASAAAGMSLQRVHLNGNSGAQAINVAACFGAQRILLLGFDMKDAADGRAHWFGQHPKPLVQRQLYVEWIYKFEAIAKDAAALGLDIVNCTPDSVLAVFPVAPISEALPWSPAS
jgi:hypothetical protein